MKKGINVNLSTSSLSWQRSTRCDGGACVEVALHQGEVVLRDSKNPHGPLLRFSRSEWAAFIGGVQDGDFRFSN